MTRNMWAVVSGGKVISEHKRIGTARIYAQGEATRSSNDGTSRKWVWVTISKIVHSMFGGETRLEPYEKIMRSGKRYYVERLWTKR